MGHTLVTEDVDIIETKFPFANSWLQADERHIDRDNNFATSCWLTKILRDFQILDSPPSLTRKQHCFAHLVAPTHIQPPKSSRVSHMMDSSQTRGVCE